MGTPPSACPRLVARAPDGGLPHLLRRPRAPGRTATARRGTAAALAPSATRSAATATCCRCHECGTVQQPVAARGAELHELYREMRDDAYLAEEAGRRATAAGCST